VTRGRISSFWRGKRAKAPELRQSQFLPNFDFGDAAEKLPTSEPRVSPLCARAFWSHTGPRQSPKDGGIKRPDAIDCRNTPTRSRKLPWTVSSCGAGRVQRTKVRAASATRRHVRASLEPDRRAVQAELLDSTTSCVSLPPLAISHDSRR
jgi:hypothetical protein